VEPLAVKITCIIPDSSDPDARIDQVGGPGWTKSEDEVIAEIEGHLAEYFVEADGTRVTVVVIEEAGGRRYLRTDPDQTTQNNLLSLPSCP
jgi:hypothetical protein